MWTSNGTISDLRGEQYSGGRRSAIEYLDIRARQIGALRWAAKAIRGGMFGRAMNAMDAEKCENVALELETTAGKDDSAARAAWAQIGQRVRGALCDVDRALLQLSRYTF